MKHWKQKLRLRVFQLSLHSCPRSFHQFRWSNPRLFRTMLFQVRLDFVPPPVCKCRCASATDVNTPHPTQHRMCCVASAMCASATDVITSQPTPHRMWRVMSLGHVCKCNGSYHTKPHTPTHVLRGISHARKCNGCNHIPTHPPPHVARNEPRPCVQVQRILSHKTPHPNPCAAWHQPCAQVQRM